MKTSLSVLITILTFTWTINVDVVANNSDPIYDNLVWSDEFDGNGAIDASKWFQQTQLPNGSSWYNGEIQHYTNRVENSNVAGGMLHVTAKRETFSDQGVTKDFTSARLNSKFAFTYGRVEVRAKLPIGIGTWPAIWMLGKNINETGAYWQTQGFGTTTWPACGEIDIMEHWGDNQDHISSAIHTPSSFGNTVNVGGRVLPNASTQFHVYSVDWFPDRMVFKVDGVTHYTYEPAVQNSDTWPFDAEQYILLNVAMLPNVLPSFTESSMEIDYVRVYQESTLDLPEITYSDVKSYPNPVLDTLNVKLYNRVNQAIEVELIDINGKRIEKTSLSLTQDELNYNTSGLENGIYFLKLKFNDESTEVVKFIKK